MKKWQAEHYTHISFRISKEIVDAFKEKCKETGDSQAAIIKKAMEDYLKTVE
ncbi:MAG: ribbon-helix-helix domain-containing protein [Acutalibacteraceae bacterium]|nr:CopG family transcriptional regulator [Clostridia bacterium]MEE1292078.1 ribbon-helix-helix domain-containing protein [Acutalibacteraceae bacterium]NLD30284.1 CopG family transcriptional regulator [Clostridiales bacterium]MBQ1314408.1 CopG family transcriptional regulator [Clostridia bacterium]MBQ1549038.1 CopG family transcriptional regulator [Clostridia bacterium]